MILILTRRFLPIFLTQFFGAFNDNVFKNALVILITYTIAIKSGEDAQVLITIAAGLFILPFFIFSATAGQLADKYNRAVLARWTKIAEIIIMLTATLAFYLGNSWFLISLLFLTGVQSAFFGPIKYAILPQLLKEHELLDGNAYVESGTFLAILLGTITGGILIIQNNGSMDVSNALILVALIGYFASRYIPSAPAPAPNIKIDHNPITASKDIIIYINNNKKILIIILAISWFWLIGATFLAQFPTFVKDYLHTQAEVVTLFLTLFSIGIAIGSFICSKIQNGAIKTTLVPFAAVGMSIFIFDLYLASNSNVYHNLHALLSIQAFTHMHQSWRIMLDILLIAVSGGIYIVPLYTKLQHISDPNYRARVIAGLNIYNSMFMVISALFTLGMLAIGRTIPEVFLIIALVNLLISIMMFKMRSL